MKTNHSFTTNSSTPEKKCKTKRRHLRIELDALKPILATLQNDSCPKCQGFVRTEGGESLSQIVIRCLNCGWQPQYQAPIFQETEETRMWRLLSTQFVSERDWPRIPVTF